MSGPSSKPAIPAWQRAQQPLKPDTQPSPKAQPESNDSNETVATALDEGVSSEAGVENSTTAEHTPKDIEQVKAFLQDPGVKDASQDKKRAFLESKGVAKDLIDQELNSASPTMNAADFASFRASTQPQPRTTPAPQTLKPAGPPIITYPEYLAEAHKPPPLITPSRIITTAYLASGLAALIYGTSTFLITPMAANLTSARHDFSSHSLSKIDALNDRLSKIVSKIPEPKTDDIDDVESITSDPTELFHRDMGTQTSPPITPTPSSLSTTTKSPDEKHTDRLAIINSHLSELLTGLEDGEDAAKERLEAVNKLRSELDTMLYRLPSTSVWSTAADGTSYGSGEEGGGGGKGDAIEEFKKEIRGVKGVLLSAKRFAPVMGVGR